MTPIFIGSGEASVLERKTLIHSLKAHASQPLDIRVFNGTHNAIEFVDGRIEPAGLPLYLKYFNLATEFSIYRYLIPQLCGFSGKALWIDSDVVCLADVQELLDRDVDSVDFVAKQDAYDDGENDGTGWGPSVMLINCERCRFDLDAIFSGIEKEEFTLNDFMRFTPAFLTRFSYKISPLPNGWNDFDFADHNTRMIHYTSLHSQPWRRPGHRYGDIWHAAFAQALASGDVSTSDVELATLRGFCRFDVLQGNSFWKHWLRLLRRHLQA